MSGIQWTTQDYLYVTAECVTGVLSVLGNGLVLLSIKKCRSLRTVTNCFIGSLAAADALVGLIIPPTVILPYLGLPRNFYGCVLVNSLVVLITNISILNLLAVALERFLAVRYPFLYQRVMSVNRALVVVAVTWVVAILIGLIPIMGWNLGEHGFKFCSFTLVIDLKYMVYFIFLGMTLPLLLAMLVIYIYIFHIIRKQQKRTKSLRPKSSSSELRKSMHRQKQEVRGAKGLAYVIVLFAVCWLPIHIMNSLTVFAPEKGAPYRWLLVAIVLSHANSVVNPFLYAFCNSKFKYAMKRILCCEKGTPSDFDSFGDTSWIRQRLSKHVQKSRTPSPQHDSSGQSTGTTVTVEVEPLPQHPEGVLNNGTANNTRPEGPATQSRTSVSIPVRSPLEPPICNGTETRAEKTGPEHKHLNEHAVSRQHRQQQRNIADNSSKESRGSSTVTFAVDEVTIPDPQHSHSVWVTPASLYTEVQPSPSPHKPTAVSDSISRQQHSDKNQRLQQSNNNRQYNLKGTTEGPPSVTNTASNVDNGQRKVDTSCEIGKEGTVELYQMITVTKSWKFVKDGVMEESSPVDDKIHRPLADAETFLSVRL